MVAKLQRTHGTNKLLRVGSALTADPDCCCVTPVYGTGCLALNLFVGSPSSVGVSTTNLASVNVIIPSSFTPGLGSAPRGTPDSLDCANPPGPFGSGFSDPKCNTLAADWSLTARTDHFVNNDNCYWDNLFFICYNAGGTDLLSGSGVSAQIVKNTRTASDGNFYWFVVIDLNRDYITPGIHAAYAVRDIYYYLSPPLTVDGLGKLHRHGTFTVTKFDELHNGSKSPICDNPPTTLTLIAPARPMIIKCPFEVTQLPDGQFLHECRGGIAHVSPSARHVRDCVCVEPQFAECRHRGKEVRTQVCSTCAGPTRIKVFACAVHGECELTARLPGVRFCGHCQDFEPKVG